MRINQKQSLYESFMNNLKESESKNYTVTIGFLGGYDGEDCDGSKDYEVFASSRADAVHQVLDADVGALVNDDLEVANIEKDEDGDWKVKVAFGEGDVNPGYHTYIFDGNLDEEDVKESALDEARYEGDLYVEAVDGTEFDYELGESVKLNKINSLYESFIDNVSNMKTLKGDNVDKFLRKYNSIYGDLPVVKEGKLYVDNIKLRGSGISKGIEATLQNGIMEVYNEEWGFTYDGNSISDMEDMSQYWFYNNYETNEEFRSKIDSAAKSLYKDMQLLASSNLTEADDIDHIVQRGNVYIPVRKGETEEKAIKRAEDTTKPVESEKSISFKMPIYSKEFKDALFKDRDALIASYDPSQVDPEEVKRKIQAGEELNTQESMYFINQEPKKGDIILSDIVRKVASDGKWVDIERYDDYEKDPVANADAADEVKDDIDLEKAAEDIRKTMRKLGIKESARLYETTNKGIQAKKDALHDKIRQALKDAGDKDWESLVDYTKRLPQDVVEALDKEEDEIWCIEMIHSILTYTNDRDIDSLIKDRYLKKYIDEFGEEKVRKLLAGEIEEYNNATIHQNVHTDSEGVTYNSVTFKDDINESASDRYQVRKFTDEDKIDKRLAGADFGVYDTKENKFIQKGSKKVMIAACDDLNKKQLKESNIVWSSDSEDDEGVWEILKDDLNSQIVPLIQSQTTDNIVFMSGTVGRWTGNHSGGKVIEVDSADDLLFGDDLDTINIFEENGNLGWEGIHHDGSHEMYFYAMPSDEATREKLVRELGIVDWYIDMYQYDNPEKDALDDALNDLYSAKRLNDILEPKDFETIAKICQPIKWK